MEDAKILKLIDQLIEMIINARKEAAIAQALIRAAVPELPESTREQVRREIGQAYDALAQKLRQKPVDAALQFLRDFEGPLQ